MRSRVYVALSVFQGVVDEVKAYRSKTGADTFVSSFERCQEIGTEQERKYQREHEDTYATWYECELEE